MCLAKVCTNPSQRRLQWSMRGPADRESRGSPLNAALAVPVLGRGACGELASLPVRFATRVPARLTVG
jgi:hypothetical protein